MKKLLFQKFLKDTLMLFFLICLSIGLIVWVIQAVNFLDFITEDGHGLYVYFSYTLFNFPKIIERILPFIFFISLFYKIIQYEFKNELIIFWTNGISKLEFINVVIVYSLLFFLIQMFLSIYISPYSQNEARSYIRSSNIDFFPSLIKEGRFIDAVDGLTIFMDSKNQFGGYKNIFLEEHEKNNKSFKKKQSQTIYAKSGKLKNENDKRYLELFDGIVVDKNNGKISNFSFKKINFDLSKFSSKTTTYPKLQEIRINLLIQCLYSHFSSVEYEFSSKLLTCKSENIDSILQETFKRIYKPFYIVLLGLLASLMIMMSKEDINYNAYRIFLFLIMMVVIALSEISLRNISQNSFHLYFYITFPIITYFTIYIYLMMKLRIKN